MTMKTMKLALAAVAVLGAGAVCAQDMGTAPAATAPATSAAVVPNAPTGTSVATQTTTPAPIIQDEAEKTIAAVEEGGKTLQEAQKEIGAGQEKYMATENKSEAKKLFKDAEALVIEKLGKLKKKGVDGEMHPLEVGFDEDSQSIIVIGSAVAVVDNPANDETFVDVRNLKALEAYLEAKASIIRALETQFDADARATTKLNSVPAETDDEKLFKQKSEELEMKRQELAKKLSELDERQAAVVNGNTVGEKFGVLLDAVIKKLDTDYKPESLTADKIQVRDQVKKQCEMLAQEIKELSEMAERLPVVPQNEIETGVRLYAEMPLLGANVLVQAESWDKETGTYMVSMAVVWSPKLQAQAVAVAHGDFAASSPGRFSIRDWMSQQSLECMVGPRRFVDDRGRNINLGFAAADMNCATTLRKANRALADAFAFQFVAFSLFGDVEAYREAKATYKDYHNKWTKEDKAKFTKKLLDVVNNKAEGTLRGCMPLSQYAREYVHPISGHRMYVAPFHLNPKLAGAASLLIQKSFDDAGLVAKKMSRDLGVRAGQRQALKDVRESKQDYNEGFTEGRNAVNANIKKAIEGRSGEPNAVRTPGAEGTVPVNVPRKNRGGAYSGDNAVDTDF